jgi:hypothetical protein
MVQEAANTIDTDQGTVSANVHVARTFLNKGKYFYAATKSVCNIDILESYPKQNNFGNC